MADLLHCLLNLLLFDIPLLDYYPNLNSSINCCLFSADTHLSFDISILFFASSKLLFECNYFEVFFETFVILSAILLPIKSPVATAAF